MNSLAAVYPTGPSYYVDPVLGNDGNDGTLGRPWATLDGARRRLTALGYNRTPGAPATVYVSPGDYWLTSALVFGTADGGSHYPVVWSTSGAPGSVKVYGGKVMTGWTLYAGSVYRTATTGPRITTLWENGVRARVARFPALVPDASYPMAQTPYLTTAPLATTQTQFAYAAGDLSPMGSWDLDSLTVLIWPGGLSSLTGGSRSWFSDILKISSFDSVARTMTTAASSVYPMYDNGVGCRYFVQGDLTFLTGPGEFYHDAVNGWLYYWPRATPITSQQIVAPAIDSPVQFMGDTPSAPAANIVLDGWDIQYSGGLQQFQVLDHAGSQFKGIVFMQNTQGIGLSRCNIHNAGLHGVYMHSANRLNWVDRSWIHNTAMYGLILENYPGWSPDIGDVNGSHAFTNVKIGNTGEVVGHGSCVYWNSTGNNLLDHFELYSSPRAGIEVVGASCAIGPAKTYTKANTIQYGKAHDLCQDSGDMGAFYTGCCAGAGQTWFQLWVDNVNANASMTDAAPSGFYSDDDAPNNIVTNVNVTNSTSLYHNNSGSNVETNCAWKAGFNASLMAPDLGARGVPY